MTGVAVFQTLVLLSQNSITLYHKKQIDRERLAQTVHTNRSKMNCSLGSVRSKMSTFQMSLVSRKVLQCKQQLKDSRVKIIHESL